MARHDLTLLRQIDVARSVQGYREDALGLAWRSTDELPPLKEVGGAQLDALEELGDDDGEPHGNRLVRAGEEGYNENGWRAERLLALDLHNLLDLRPWSQCAWRNLEEGH